MGRPTAADRSAALGGRDELLLSGLQALADPVRLRIVRLLSQREQCVCHLTEILGISQASVSHHMGILRRAGLVDDRRDARWTYYRLAPDAVASLWRSVDTLLTVVPGALATAACCDPEEACRQEAPTQPRSLTVVAPATYIPCHQADPEGSQPTPL